MKETKAARLERQYEELKEAATSPEATIDTVYAVLNRHKKEEAIRVEEWRRKKRGDYVW